MPTYDYSARFLREFHQLTPHQQALFLVAVRKLVADLKADRLRSGFRIKRVGGHEGLLEMTWAPDGRATFEYGDAIRSGDTHIIWRRIGTHDILDEP